MNKESEKGEGGQSWVCFQFEFERAITCRARGVIDRVSTRRDSIVRPISRLAVESLVFAAMVSQEKLSCLHDMSEVASCQTLGPTEMGGSV